MGHKTVYLVDNITRIILPESGWSNRVLERLREQGHQVIVTDEDPKECRRGDDELSRMCALLDSTGL